MHFKTSPIRFISVTNICKLRTNQTKLYKNSTQIFCKLLVKVLTRPSKQNKTVVEIEKLQYCEIATMKKIQQGLLSENE